MTTLQDVLSAIASGDLDSNFDQIARAMNARNKATHAAAAAAIAASLVAGDRVRLNEQTRPVALRGKEGTVTAFGRSKVSVRFDGDLVDTQCPATLLDKIGDAVVETAAEASERLIKAFDAKHAQYPQYADHTVGARAVRLRKNWTGRGERLAKGTFVLLFAKEEAMYDGTPAVSIWHPNMGCQTLTSKSDVETR